MKPIIIKVLNWHFTCLQKPWLASLYGLTDLCIDIFVVSFVLTLGSVGDWNFGPCNEQSKP